MLEVREQEDITRHRRNREIKEGKEINEINEGKDKALLSEMFRRVVSFPVIPGLPGHLLLPASPRIAHLTQNDGFLSARRAGHIGRLLAQRFASEHGKREGFFCVSRNAQVARLAHANST